MFRLAWVGLCIAVFLLRQGDCRCAAPEANLWMRAAVVSLPVECDHEHDRSGHDHSRDDAPPVPADHGCEHHLHADAAQACLPAVGCEVGPAVEAPLSFGPPLAEDPRTLGADASRLMRACLCAHRLPAPAAALPVLRL